MKAIIRHLRQAALLGVTDAELLDRFLDGHDEDAFDAIVQRLGPMVWGVCRRHLVNRQDIEDAFQATFLVLVRKAATIRPRGLVGNWLYGVAYRTALRARDIASQRNALECPDSVVADLAAKTTDQFHDWLPLLDHELSRLPD